MWRYLLLRLRQRNLVSPPKPISKVERGLKSSGKENILFSALQQTKQGAKETPCKVEKVNKKIS